MFQQSPSKAVSARSVIRPNELYIYIIYFFVIWQASVFKVSGISANYLNTVKMICLARD